MRQEDHPRWADLVKASAELDNMIFFPALFSSEEILGQALKLTRLMFDIAGCGHEEETQRSALARAIADYVDVPAPPPVIPTAALDSRPSAEGSPS